MRSERASDQAEGLRRLLLRATARVVTVAAARPGMGATSVVVNLAAALARIGKDVLVLDENLAHDNIGNMLALKPRYDLLHAARGDKTLREILLHPLPGVCVLPAARAIQALPQLAAAERVRLLQSLSDASRDADIVLVDAASNTGDAHSARGNAGASRSASLLSSGLAPDQPLLLVLNPNAVAITESYALIKRMAMQDGRHSFDLVVNKARDEQEARAVFGNIAQVARRHLQVRVEFLGYIPLDDRLKRATQLCRPVIDAFPLAQSAPAFGELGRSLLSLPAAGNGEANGLPDVVQRLMRQTRHDMVHVT